MTQLARRRDNAPARVLVLGPSNWLEGTVASLADDDSFAVDARTEAPGTGAFDGVDCVLTDDPSSLSEIPEDVLTVVAIEVDDAIDVDDLLSRGVTDVVRREEDEERPILRNRLRRAAEAATIERRANERDAWFQALIGRSSAQLIVFDERMTHQYVSPSVERISGHAPEELLEKGPSDVVHGDDLPEFQDAFDAACAGEPGATSSAEYRVRHADGSWHVHEAVFTNLLSDPAVEGVVASIRDVTELRHVERELNRTFERVTDAFFSLNADWQFTYVNERARSMFASDFETLLGENILDAFPGLVGTPFQYEAVEAMETQEPRTIESWYEPAEAWIEARLYPSPSGLSVYFTDVTARVEREQELVERTEQIETLVENAPVVSFVLDPDGTFTLYEGEGLESIVIEPDEMVGERIFDRFGNHPGIVEDASRALDGNPVHSHREFEGRIFETWYRPVDDDGELERVVGVAVDVTERVRYEETLNALQAATRHLLTVETAEAAFETIADVAAEVVNLDTVVVYRYDERENELVPSAQSAAFVDQFGVPPAIEPTEAVSWDVFVEGELRAYDDVRTADNVYDPETDARSALYVPLGEHGVLAAASTEIGVFDDRTVELARLLGATAEAALDRIGRTQRLHDRERELQRQNQHLERLNRASGIRQDVESLLLRAADRGEIERGVCERIADVEELAFAWIGEPDTGGNQLLSRTSAGSDRGYLDAVTITTVDDSAAEPAGRAARSRSPVVVDNVAESLRNGEWRAEAASRTLQSVVAVPLVYDDYLYGVLAVYADQRDAFDDPLRSTMEELGETIAYAIDTVQRKNALLSDEVTEVELAINDPTSPLQRLADRLETSLERRGSMRHDDGTTTAFVAVDHDLESKRATAVGGILTATVIERGDDRTLLKLRLANDDIGTIIANHGGTVRDVTADAGRLRVTVDVPSSVQVRELLSGLARDGREVELLARREAQKHDRERSGSALLEDLTDRQREVVQAAYYGGFFKWPREATGEDIAESLDISPPAFHNHVRAVQRTLLSALFEREFASAG